jgi:hypothetical protein
MKTKITYFVHGTTIDNEEGRYISCIIKSYRK